MLATLSLLTLPWSLAFLPQDPTPRWLAMTRSGQRIEVVDKPKAGTLEFDTPYGHFFTPRDPVAVILPVSRGDSWQQALQRNPASPLADLIDAFAADGRIDALLALADHLDASATVETSVPEGAHAEDLRFQRDRERILIGRALLSWGRRLDPVPAEIARDDRVEWLWQQLLRTKGPASLLYGGRLLQEAEPGQSGVGKRQIAVSELKEALDSADPFDAAVAAHLCSHQMVVEASVGSNILGSSLDHDHPLTRDACAEGIARLWPNHARQYWADVLFRSTDERRIRAAWNLVDHLAEQAEAPLVLAMAAKDIGASRSFTIGNMTLMVDTRRDEPRNPLAGLPLIQPGGA